MLKVITDLQRRKKGFTLVEITMTTVLVAFLGAAMYLVLSQGIRLWNRATRHHPEIDIYIGFEKLASDLHNTMKYSTAKFKGSIDSMQFYIKNSAKNETPMQMSYIFDRQSKKIKRSKLDYRQLLNTVQTPVDEIVMSDVVDSTFSYYFSDKTGTGSWKNSWDDACFPEAVRMSIDYLDQNQVRKVARTIWVPIGGCGPI